MSTHLKRCKTECVVCGAPSAGMNRGGLTCISCRSFFVRSARSARSFICIGGGTCQIITGKESFCCKACRYRKCVEAGMNIEPVSHFRKKDGSYTKHAESLIQRHVVPAISLGYKFVATASNPMGAVKCAQFFSNIDKLTIARGALSENLRRFTLQVPLAYCLLDSNYCFSKKEHLEIPPAEAGPLLIAHNFARTLADVIDFSTAIPEFALLTVRDKLRLLQKNFAIMALLRNSTEFYWDPSPSELEATLASHLRLHGVSKYTSNRLQMFRVFMAEQAAPTFKKVKIIKEEVGLLLLIACFTPCIDCSDEGRQIIKQARSKYINILKSYNQEMYPHMNETEKVKRFRLLLDYIGQLQNLSVSMNSCLSAQVLNNADSMLGQLTHDLHVHVYSD